MRTATCDDLLPQPNWPEGHAPKIPALIENLETRSGFVFQTSLGFGPDDCRENRGVTYRPLGTLSQVSRQYSLLKFGANFCGRLLDGDLSISVGVEADVLGVGNAWFRE